MTQIHELILMSLDHELIMTPGATAARAQMGLVGGLPPYSSWCVYDCILGKPFPSRGVVSRGVPKYRSRWVLEG